MKKHIVIALILSVLGGPVLAAVPSHLNAFSEGERVIYGRIVESYRKNKLAETVKQRNILAHNYPKSVHLDNAYYLTGVLHYQQNQLAEAVRDFGIVQDNFQHSNKRPAAMFAKAMTYQKLGLKPQAERLWNLIVQEYPGSQESQRAWMQLKVAKLDSLKKTR